MKKEDILFFNQLVKSLEDAGKSLQQSYEKMNYRRFNKSKKIMFQIQKEISDIIK